MLDLTAANSDISRTNQLKLNSSPEEVAEKLFLYLHKYGKGIDFFSIKDWYNKDDFSVKGKNAQADFYRKQHKDIKQEIENRLSAHGVKPDKSSIQYFFSYADGKKYVFYLAPYNAHSGWKQLFCEKWSVSNRERIFNLVFKFYLLSQESLGETIDGFEELLFVHTKNLSQTKKALLVWGQNLLVKYNYHNVLTLTLTRKSRSFLPKDLYSTLHGDELGELIVYKDKNYYFERDRDARRKNSILFMRFDKDNDDYDKFKKTQLYHYQNLITKLGDFLGACDIDFNSLDMQSNYFLENPFIKNIDTLQSLEVINNTGFDLDEDDKRFLQQYLKHLGVVKLTFFDFGRSISAYEQVNVEGEDEPCWKISEITPWSDIVLDKKNNYLVFNRLLEEEVGSMAYQREDGLWYPSSELHDKSVIDFYSQLKRKFSYINTGDFFSTQGINISKFLPVKDSDDENSESLLSLLVYNHLISKKIDKDILEQDTRPFIDKGYLDVASSISSYIIGQTDGDKIKQFNEKHGIKITPEFQKVFIELGIKNWIRQSLESPIVGLPIVSQSFQENNFFAIYVRSPRNQETKAVAVEFIYKEGYIHIKDVLSDLQEIMGKFPFLKTLKNKPGVLKNDQEYFVDEANKIFINCYTDDTFTPTLIGRPDILENLQNGTLEINRKNKDENSSRLLPLVSYYSGEIKPANRIQNMICFDLKQEAFIQYYVPPGKVLDRTIKRGFRVYHLIGKTYDKTSIPSSELINHPITALHFSTLTQNILKISENSQSSLLQKVAKVLIEN